MNLTYADDVKKTPAITRAVDLIDPFFDGELSIITSGLRTPQEQVELIISKMQKHGIYADFPEVDLHRGSDVGSSLEIEDSLLFWWQRGWSKLLQIGEIINPPIACMCLYDYFRPNKENMKGKVIQESPHSHGIAFDIGGGDNLTEKAKRVLKAYQSGNCFITDWRIEGINNCAHIGVQQIG